MNEASEAAPLRYGIRRYQLPEELVARLYRVESWRTITALVIGWIGAIALIEIGIYLDPRTLRFWLCYIPLGFLIAGRQGVMLQIVHEGSHRLVSTKKWVNDFVADWLAAMPVGLSLQGYTTGHMRHHAYTNTDRDLPTDLEKHEITDRSDVRLFKKFLRDLLGVTAIRSALGHVTRTKNGAKPAAARAEDSSRSRREQLHRFGGLVIVQALIITLVFRLNLINYILLWIVPLLSFNMILLRIRGIAEHGLPGQLQLPILQADQGNLYTRSMMTPLRRSSVIVAFTERVLIGSLSCNFHHEHHLIPNVPFYNLHKLHEEVGTAVEAHNSHVYVEGYFHAFFKGVQASVRS